ncbi:hypothetical protein PP749_gp006 [Rhizobium phage RHEph22]|uniref:Uncharacterized protein n=1 Tax=Rhizobium phage RHEph22 TaxID=2836135 RepID=A0AAE8B4V3_9CAUD|nr:hypothetical protein PP749_gp006 [Rhizobium phage RHEph22]QXV74679.1 hypothetical protein [Rhizobium phage RHEph22]QXV74777.1 hypothetical protein [Rhizobium phage RHEph24]
MTRMSKPGSHNTCVKSNWNGQAIWVLALMHPDRLGDVLYHRYTSKKVLKRDLKTRFAMRYRHAIVIRVRRREP